MAGEDGAGHGVGERIDERPGAGVAHHGLERAEVVGREPAGDGDPQLDRRTPILEDLRRPQRGGHGEHVIEVGPGAPQPLLHQFRGRDRSPPRGARSGSSGRPARPRPARDRPSPPAPGGSRPRRGRPRWDAHGLSPGRSGGASGSCRRAPCARASRSSATAPRSGRPPPGHLGHAVLPPGLAATAHHQQVAVARHQPVGRPLVGGLVGVPVRAWPDQERAAIAEDEQGDDGVVEPAHVAVAMERHHVAPVAVEGQRRAAEADVVAVLDGAVGLDEDGVGRGGGGERRAQPGLVDPVVVAVHPTLPEGRRWPPGARRARRPRRASRARGRPTSGRRARCARPRPPGSAPPSTPPLPQRRGYRRREGRALVRRRRILIPWGVCVDE